MNIIIIPCYIINNNIEQYNNYKKLVDINIKNIKNLNYNGTIEVLNKNVKTLRDMWYDILSYIMILTNKGNNVLYMEADTIIFKNFNEIFEYNKVLCFGLGYWNMSFKFNNEFNFYEYLNSGLVYFPKNTNYISILDLYNNWPNQDDKKKLTEIFPCFNYNFGNRQLDYSGTYWEYIINMLFYNQFNNKTEGIEFISNNLGLWKYNYRGCLYKKYPHKNLLCNSNNISHCHFLIYSSNKDKNERFLEIFKIYNEINNLINDTELLNKYILDIPDNMF
tara:strand:+ start:695 stop:1525 length:831 start_codon:yes stop_codon:yes gene_type:complete